MKKKYVHAKPIVRTTKTVTQSKKNFFDLAGKIRLDADSVTALRKDSLL